MIGPCWGSIGVADAEGEVQLVMLFATAFSS